MSQATQMKPGRYSVGQQLVGVAVIVASPGRDGAPASKRSLTNIPAGWRLQENGVKVSDFLFKVFTVAEYHRVPNLHDDKGELTCDGYILRATDEKENSRKWLNQYPSASYSQLSDIGDAIFTIDVGENTSEEISKMIDDWKNPWQFITVERMLEGIVMPKHDAKKIIEDLNSEYPRYSQYAVAHTQGLYFQFIKAFDRDVGDRFKIIDEEVFPGYFAKRVVTK